MSPPSAISHLLSAKSRSYAERCKLKADGYSKLGLTRELSEVDRAWEAEMGGWSRLARLVAIDRRALVVEVDSSPALQELSLRRKELVRRLNRHFETPFLKHITVRMSQNGR